MQENNVKTIKIPSQFTPKICVVDDDDFVVRLIGRTLSMSGYKDSVFYDRGEKLVDELKTSNNSYSLVISDIVLPGINGFELCAKIKELNPDLPVILISGFDIRDVHLKVIESGADDFIAKPFNPVELITRVKIHLARYEKAVNNSTAINFTSYSDIKKLPFIGDQIGDYLITDTVAWGKSSFIFKVVKKSSRSVYSLKMLAPQMAGFKDFIMRFQNEINMMEKINHPNIVGFIDRGEYNSLPFVVMEYINGLDLEEYLITRGKIPINDALAIAHGVASAIAGIHTNKIIHRDIKLKNIIFDVSAKSPKLIDFGIAKEFEAPHITRDGFVVGTPIYMAPEIFEGEEATVKSDIYSFGATMYHMFTGSPPFVGETSKELYKKHLNELPPPMTKFRDDVPPHIEQLICKYCLAKKQSDRPDSMKYVEEQFKAYIKQLR